MQSWQETLQFTCHIKLQVSFVEYTLFYKALVQKRPIISCDMWIAKFLASSIFQPPTIRVTSYLWMKSCHMTCEYHTFLPALCFSLPPNKFGHTYELHRATWHVNCKVFFFFQLCISASSHVTHLNGVMWHIGRICVILSALARIVAFANWVMTHIWIEACHT